MKSPIYGPRGPAYMRRRVPGNAKNPGLLIFASPFQNEWRSQETMPSGTRANQGGDRRKPTPLGIIARSACRCLCRMRHRHLYVILDIFSRYVVGWMIAHRESAELAEQLIADTIDKQHIAPGTLTLHADRGTSMRSKPVAALLVDLDVAKTHSRPHVSDDNPYSEAQFKTLKYRPDFPPRFGSIEDARAHCQDFFRWYNTEHRHSGIGLMPPDTVHYGRSTALTAKRAVTLDIAFAAHPARFKGLAPKPPALPAAAWINPPKKEATPVPRDNHKPTFSDNPPMHLMVEHASLGATPVKPEAARGGGLKGQALRAYR